MLFVFFLLARQIGSQAGRWLLRRFSSTTPEYVGSEFVDTAHIWRPEARRLTSLVEQPVGQRRDLSDPRLHRIGEAQQRRVARISGSALYPADLRQVGVRQLREFLLTEICSNTNLTHGLAERRMLRRASPASPLRWHSLRSLATGLADR